MQHKHVYYLFFLVREEKTETKTERDKTVQYSLAATFIVSLYTMSLIHVKPTV